MYTEHTRWVRVDVGGLLLLAFALVLCTLNCAPKECGARVCPATFCMDQSDCGAGCYCNESRNRCG